MVPKEDERLLPASEASAYCGKSDEYSAVRLEISDRLSRAGCDVWVDRWLAIKAIEELIDQKIAAAAFSLRWR